MVRRKKTYQPKYETIIAENCKVIKIDYQNQKQTNGDFKTCFYCPSYMKKEGRMFIAWGQTNFKVGDTLSIKGRLKGEVFLCWSIQIKKFAPSEQEPDYDAVAVANLKRNLS